jgi:hypothetical protein
LFQRLGIGELAQCLRRVVSGHRIHFGLSMSEKSSHLKAVK